MGGAGGETRGELWLGNGVSELGSALPAASYGKQKETNAASPRSHHRPLPEPAGSPFAGPQGHAREV